MSHPPGLQVDPDARHTLWVEHEARVGQPLAATRAGARLDLGRLLNTAAAAADAHVTRRLPALLWRLPLAGRLYRLAVPPEDAEQLRFRLSGWTVEMAHDFEHAPMVGLSKRLGRDFSLAATYDAEDHTGAIQLRGRWLAAAARLGRAEGGGWRQPGLTLNITPLGFL